EIEDAGAAIDERAADIRNRITAEGALHVATAQRERPLVAATVALAPERYADLSRGRRRIERRHQVELVHGRGVRSDVQEQVIVVLRIVHLRAENSADYGPRAAPRGP